MDKRSLLLAYTLLILSCSKDKEDRATFDGDTVLNGAWQLTNVSCFCFFDEDTDFGATTLLFDIDRDAVTVEHMGNDVFFKEQGTHVYDGMEDKLLFGPDEAYTFLVKGDVLKLIYVDEPNIADDEVVFTLQRR